ncbi:MAG: hypothetical protein JW395_3176 [Nitrospira sp.]|nr:hypothetical protein [Nitrospira sp.]
MAALDKQDDVASSQHPALQILLLGSVEIHAQFALLDEERLLGEEDLPRHGVMHVRRNDLARRVVHVGQLLGQLVGGDEMDARLMEPCSNDDSQQLLAVMDLENFVHECELLRSFNKKPLE